MATSVYPIHRAAGRPIRFKGLEGQYILIAAAGLIGDFLLFILLYCCNTPAWICISVTIGLGVAFLSACMNISRKYGVHGIRKSRARRMVPTGIQVRSRQSFTQ